MDFETLAGIYTYAMDHHTGQWSRLYRLMSRIRFNAPDHVLDWVLLQCEELGLEKV